MPVALPFCMAWVDGPDVVFDPEIHAVCDEYVFSAERDLQEMEKPLLKVEMEDPGVGLLSESRKQWALFSYDDGSTGGPRLFFRGRIVGNPVQLFDKIISVQFIADPRDWKLQRQLIAKDKKVLPYYAPEWIDPVKRDDPDKVLEAYAEVWDVNPNTHEVRAVPILGTDDTSDLIEIDESGHFADGMKSEPSQPPTTAIMMDATIPWVQSARGFLDLGNHLVESYCDAIVQQWPQPLTSLGDGYSVYNSSAQDTKGADTAQSVSISYSWQNKEKTHADGDTLSTSYSQTLPIGNIGLNQVLTEVSQIGFLDPFAVDGDGDPDPINIPASYNQTSAHVVKYVIETSLLLQYIAARQRTERVIFTISADLQAVAVDPGIDKESEVITLTASDVSVPILDLLNWTSVAGQFVDVGQVVFPDDPQLPGGRTIQIATVAGIAGMEPPDFSDVPGFPTIDNEVTWNSLGSATPPGNAADWKKNQHYNAGDIITPHRPIFIPYNVMIAAGLHKFPPAGTSISEGSYFQYGDGFIVCTEAGATLPNGGFGTAVFATLSALPTGTAFFVCTQEGDSGGVLPVFDETLHAVTNDGDAVWTCIGTGEIPIGGVPGQINAPSFITQLRGEDSLMYLALLVIARHLWRSRCVDITFEMPFEDGLDIYTHNTIILRNSRLFGGQAIGKVKNATLIINDTAGAICRVTISCAVGKDTVIEEYAGDPSYVEEGYVERGYQQYDNAIRLLSTRSDLAYTRPVYKVTDDGVTFPLDRSGVVLVDEVRAIGDMEEAVRGALVSMAAAAKVGQGNIPRGGLGRGNPYMQAYAQALQKQMLSANSVQAATSNNPIWIEYQLKPLNAGPFHSVYNIKFSELSIAKQVDLGAAETTT